LIATVFSVTAANAPKKQSKKAGEADKLFASAEVLKIRIEISPEGIKILEKYSWQFGPQGDREQVKATVREGGKNLHQRRPPTQRRRRQLPPDSRQPRPHTQL
jgi:hypothetical protein